MLAEFIGRSLLTVAGEDLYAAHELQYNVMTRRLGADGLAAALDRLAAAPQPSSRTASESVHTATGYGEATQAHEVEGRRLPGPNRIPPDLRDDEEAKAYEITLGQQQGGLSWAWRMRKTERD